MSVADLVEFKFSVVLRFGDMLFIPHCLLLKAAYGPGQPPSLVFATPPPPQMNSAPQPRQVKVTPCVVPPPSVVYLLLVPVNHPFPTPSQRLLTRLLLLEALP